MQEGVNKKKRCVQSEEWVSRGGYPVKIVDVNKEMMMGPNTAAFECNQQKTGRGGGDERDGEKSKEYVRKNRRATTLNTQ